MEKLIIFKNYFEFLKAFAFFVVLIEVNIMNISINNTWWWLYDFKNS